jgi:hypothetical protein
MKAIFESFAVHSLFMGDNDSQAIHAYKLSDKLKNLLRESTNLQGSPPA